MSAMNAAEQQPQAQVQSPEERVAPGVVYLVYGKLPNEFYVGSTRMDLSVRKMYHLNMAVTPNKKGEFSGGKLYTLMRAYVAKEVNIYEYFNIKAIVCIPACTDKQLLAMEQVKIEELNAINLGLNTNNAVMIVRKAEQDRLRQAKDVAEQKWKCHLCVWDGKPAVFKTQRTKNDHYAWYHSPTFFEGERVYTGGNKRERLATIARQKDKEFTEQKRAEIAELTKIEILEPSASTRARMSEARDRAKGLTKCKICDKILTTKRGLGIHMTRQHPNPQPELLF